MKSVLMLLMLLSFNLMANDKGNGGCPVCQKSYQKGLEAAVKLYDLGLKKVQEAVPMIESLDDIYKTAQDRKVIPAKKRELDGRTLLSFVETQTTKVHTRSYEKLEDYSKLKMEYHELFVLMGIETDGVYNWTTRLMKLLPNYKRLSGQTYSCVEGKCIIHTPVIKEYDYSDKGYLVLEKDTDTNGVCRHFGLGQVQDVQYTKVRGHNVARIDQNGLGYRFYFVQNYYNHLCYNKKCSVVKEITCNER